MKKMRIIMGAATALCALMPAGCSKSTGEEYKSDLKALLSMEEELEDARDKKDMDDLLEAYQDAVEDADVSTAEGKALKKDFEKLSDLIEQTFETIADNDTDKDDRKAIEEDLEDLEEDMEEHLKSFMDAAREAGLSEEEVEKIEELDIEF